MTVSSHINGFSNGCICGVVTLHYLLAVSVTVDHSPTLTTLVNISDFLCFEFWELFLNFVKDAIGILMGITFGSMNI